MEIFLHGDKNVDKWGKCESEEKIKKSCLWEGAIVCSLEESNISLFSGGFTPHNIDYTVAKDN